jgi:hypothetical protein
VNRSSLGGWYRPGLLVSDTTLETPEVLGPEGRGTPPGAPSGDAGGRPFVARHVWWLVGLAVVVVAALLLLITDTRPGYDPYGWLDWGYQTLRGSLDLGGAPSWKPYTYLFNVPYAIFGHWALYIWMLTAVSVSLAGAVFGGRIAYRLADAGPDRRWAAWAAAVFAGAGVLGIDAYFHYVLSAQSDSMLVTTCLAAVDCYLNRRYRWAWWLLALASLGRPEVWPFAGLYAIWMWVKFPRARWMLVVGVAVNAFLWFGVPTITNGRPNIAGQLALKSPRELHSNKIVGTFQRYAALDYLPLELAALLGVVLAYLRRQWVYLTLAGAVLLWVIIEIAFTLHGFPGVPRYLFEPAGLTAVLAGVTFGWLLLDARRYHARLPSWAGIPLAAILVLSMIPDVIHQGRAEHKDIVHEQARTVQVNRLNATISALGGPKAILRCGRPVNNVEYVSITAWYMHLDTGYIGHRPQYELRQKYPIVMFTPLTNGWAIKPYRSPAALASTCAKLNSLYVPTARHPQGVLVPK